MKFDIFFSLCQTPVFGFKPTERQMFENFFEQVRCADELGFETAWLAESHLSSETQKSNKNPVIPFFEGEVGVNTDSLQLAHHIFAQTKNIQVGTSVRNILCNGGPLAHAEALAAFLNLHGLNPKEHRKLQLGFAAGRFDFSNAPYGVRARFPFEELAFKVIKRKLFKQAVAIFLKAFRGDEFSSDDVPAIELRSEEFSEDVWKELCDLHPQNIQSVIRIDPYWQFEKVRIIPKDFRRELCEFILGSHDPDVQIFANTIYPCKVFNLSITPGHTIEQTHERMLAHFHPDAGPWRRDCMPRTTLVFMEPDPALSAEAQSRIAKERARAAIQNYHKALQGTIEQKRIDDAVDNALCGSPQEIVAQIRERFAPEDRLMLWFDFNCHDTNLIKKSMTLFKEQVMGALDAATVGAAS